MNILQLCNKLPVPPIEGGPIAMYHLAKALLSCGYAIDVLAISTPKFASNENIISKYTSKTYNIENIYINTNITVLGALSAFLHSKPYHLTRFCDERFRNKLIIKLKQKNYSCVIFETLYMAPYLKDVRKFSKASCMLRSHNIEHKIWERISLNEKNPFKKKYLKYLSSLLLKYELKVIPEFDSIACISETDKQYYLSMIPDSKIDVIPFGIDQEEHTSIKPGGTGFYYVGSMDWLPNIEGIKWFFEKVIPELEKKTTDIRISLVGRNMPDWVYRHKSPLVEVIGEVENIFDFISHKSVLLVPLISGSGIRIKIIEAMLMEKAVISTSTGAEGLLLTNGENVIIADKPDEFANAIFYLHSNPLLAKSIGIKAKKFVSEKHNYQTVINNFEKLFFN